MNILYISTNPGDPSTLWQSDSGKFYATKKEAMRDKGQELNPDDYEIETSWWVRNKKQLTKTIIASAIISIIICIIFKYK